jgi:RNA polymerase sigma-70 factor (sigma-E family)
VLCQHGHYARPSAGKASCDNLTAATVVTPSVKVRLRERQGLTRDAEAEFEDYVGRDGNRLMGLAVLLTGDRHDAEDLVQMALLRSARHWSAACEQPEGYTRTVLVNLARDRWRARRRHSETLLVDLPTAPVAGDTTAAVLDRQELLRACWLLPARQRAVLVLRFWEDRSIDETAAVLGCTPGTVKSQTHRALARLRAVLQVHDASQPAVGARGRKQDAY